MLNFKNTDIQKIINAVTQTSIETGLQIYLFGDQVLSSLFDSLPTNTFNFIIASPNDINIHKLYLNLLEKITINKEIERTDTIYHIQSNEFELIFLIKPGFQPYEVFYDFTIQGVLYDLGHDRFLDNDCLKDANAKIIKNIKSSTDWTTKDLLNFAILVGNYNGTVNDIQLNNLKEIELNSREFSSNEILSVLNSKQPGKTIKFISDTFKDGKSWVIKNFVDIANTLNIPLSEDFTTDSFFAKKKLDLVNIYNEFYLSSNTTFETEKSQSQRLNSTLKILFDSPDVNLEKPYIDRIVVTTTEAPAVELFSDCPYPPCTCDPNSCAPKCCCCSSNYIVNNIKVSCHNRVKASCNQDGTTPGPNEAIFPSTCPHCQEMCDIISGRIEGQSCQNLPYMPWWGTNNSPVFCNCKMWSGATEGEGDCLLYCIEQPGDRCSSKINVTGGDCSFRVSLTPGNDCCTSRPPGFTAMSASSTTAGATLITMVEGLPECNADWVYYDTSMNFSSTVTSASLSIRVNFPGLTVDPTRNRFFYINAFSQFLNIPYIPSVFTYEDYITFTINASLINSGAVSGTYTGNITVQMLDNILNPFEGKSCLTTNTFTVIIDNVNPPGYFPASCQCLDLTPIPILKNLPECSADTPPEHCYNFEIQKCIPGQPNCTCNNISSVTVCGNTISITPTNSVMVCCSDVGFGCTCPSITCPPRQCCGATCGPLCNAYATLEEAQSSIWAECYANAAYVETSGCKSCCPDLEGDPGDPNYPCDLLDPANPQHQTLLLEKKCCDCPSANHKICCDSCRLAFHDGNCGFYFKTRSEVNQEVEIAWTQCTSSGGGNIPVIKPPDMKCDIQIECLEDDNIEGNSTTSWVNSPSITILNNGIGLVAYENIDDVSSIKIKQLKSSAKAKSVENRTFNYGRLQNPIGWNKISGYYVAKLYYNGTIDTDRYSQ